MGFMCDFVVSHPWVWLFNVEDPVNRRIVGVYKCPRCKDISIGSPRSLPLDYGVENDVK